MRPLTRSWCSWFVLVVLVSIVVLVADVVFVARVMLVANVVVAGVVVAAATRALQLTDMLTARPSFALTALGQGQRRRRGCGPANLTVMLAPLTVIPLTQRPWPTGMAASQVLTR